ELASDVYASIGFQGAVSAAEGADGAWMLSLESVPKAGPRLYGRYTLPGPAGDGGPGAPAATIGLENKWELVPGLSLGVRAEGAAKDGGAEMERSGSWTLTYVDGAPLRLTLQQETEVRGGSLGGATRFSAEGRTETGYAYQ